MSQNHMTTATPPAAKSVEEMNADLISAIKARDKTIKVLVDQAQVRQRGQSGPFGVFKLSAALQAVVARRTVELELQNQQLEKAHLDLKTAQEELNQAQKLESVGRLAAGVAHEINTPVQFVNDSVYFVRDSLNDLMTLLSMYHEASDGTKSSAEWNECMAKIEEFRESIELNYLLDQIPKALDRCVDGLSRVTEIVRSMKEFSHPDRKEKSMVDLNRSIQSTLTVARNEYKYVADVETDLGQIPHVQCHGGEVNQVFLNLIVNAAHAIAEKNGESGARGRIRIKSESDGTHVTISVEDDGAGIPESIAHKIFEPFFTTKSVGKGTGQGLSISRNVIVQKHGGELTFSSVPGVGTTFRVRIPIAPSAAVAGKAQG